MSFSILMMSVLVSLVSYFVITARARGGLPPVTADMRLLAGNSFDATTVQGSQAHLGRAEVVAAVGGMSFKTAIRAASVSGAAQEWNIQLAADTVKPIKSGDVVLARFWLRCVESMTGEGVAGFVFELNGGDYAKAAQMRASAGAAWMEYAVPFQATRDYAAGETHVCFRLGYDRQTIEIGGVELINYGSAVGLAELPRTRVTYPGREANAPWRMAAERRIETIRKGDLVVRVVDASGKPVPEALVKAKLQRHQFGFGTAVDARVLTGSSADSERYRAIVARYFNRAVFENDMKWPALHDGVPAETDRAMLWLRERNIDVRGHNLVWPSWRWLPKQLQTYRDNPDELRRRTAEHITRTVSHFRGQLIHWDVVNEPFSEHDLLDILGQDIMVDWYKLARVADPDCKLYLNDYGIFDSGLGKNAHQDHFYETLKVLQAKGAPLDGIGIQSHFAADPPPPEALLETLDRFAGLRLPIESTELSVNFEDRQLQADYLRDYMTALFSHPSVEGIVLWGFWSGRHWRPDAALYAQDWSVRPIGKAFNDLLETTWMTDASQTTGDDGRTVVRGFAGQYEITAAASGRTATVKADLPVAGTTINIVLAAQGAGR